MGEWYDAAASTSSHITAGRLELFLVCDIAPENPYALEAARLALAPLPLFPRLRDCHVRLSGVPSHPLQQMTQAAVSQACGRVPPARNGPANPKMASALIKIPSELRIRILEYTDLVTPWTEVSWSRQNHAYELIPSPCVDINEECPPDEHHGCKLHRCYPCLVETIRGREVHFAGCCFCRVRHGAFTSACSCWAPPTDLFLICRTLYRDAQFVFFSRNRFIIHDYCAREFDALPKDQYELARADGTADPGANNDNKTGKYPFDRLAVSEFFRDRIPSQCLAHLRFVELVFPPYVPQAWPHREHPAILDWIATVGWMRDKINARALKLRVVMADFRPGPPGGVRQNMTPALAGDIYRGYRAIIKPLKPLVHEDGLARFYMQVAHPWRWTEDIYARAEEDDAFLVLMEAGLTRRVLGHVLGPEGSQRRNEASRDQPSKSTWQRWYRNQQWY